jgi:hypothetical protein
MEKLTELIFRFSSISGVAELTVPFGVANPYYPGLWVCVNHVIRKFDAADAGVGRTLGR